jgi:hypothetical protein
VQHNSISTVFDLSRSTFTLFFPFPSINSTQLSFFSSSPPIRDNLMMMLMKSVSNIIDYVEVHAYVHNTQTYCDIDEFFFPATRELLLRKKKCIREHMLVKIHSSFNFFSYSFSLSLASSASQTTTSKQVDRFMSILFSL